MGKYPWIPKDYYPAVMFACKIIRETHYFNKAIDQASDYYGVDPEILEKHVRDRIAAGKRNKSAKGTSFKWFVVEHAIGCDANGIGTPTFKIHKAKNEKTLEHKLAVEERDFDRRNDYGGSYAPYAISRIVGEYKTQSEAKAECDRLESMGYREFKYEKEEAR